MLIIILLIAVFAFLLVITVIGLLLLAKKGSTTASAPEVSAERMVQPSAVPTPFASAIDISKPPIFVQLDPFTVNLRTAEDENSHYLQTNISLRVNEQKTADALKGWTPEIRNRINMILTSKTIDDVQNDLGQEKLQNEILRGLNAMFGVPPPPPEVPQAQTPYGPIQGVLFNSFIVQ
ncbi:MAG: flagellar basal body-associated FliL family protein [Azoarcus sp.]|nr:flagellar basal body-associated FliL family protein [Azoarcus sp.]